MWNLAISFGIFWYIWRKKNAEFEDGNQKSNPVTFVYILWYFLYNIGSLQAVALLT